MRAFAVASLLVFLAGSLCAQGVPVESELIRAACGACHASDDEGRMSRISYQRKTPEGWQITLKRMIRTNDLDLTPQQAREIVRYLSDHHGLAPEEERPYFYRAEKRPRVESFEDEVLEQTCVRCHLGARFLTQRRTAEEWALLKGMHIGYFPVIESQSFRGPSEFDDATPAADDAPRTDWRVDDVLATLAERFPFETPEWNAFRAKGAGRGVSGRWLLRSHEPGRGPITGVVTFTGADGDYSVRAEIQRADGTRHERDGKGVLYGGYSWRGTSSGSGLGELREVMMLSGSGAELSGRMFHGTFGELGIDVTLSRLGNDPRIAAVTPRALRAGAGNVRVTVYGANFDRDVFADELGFGQGVSVVGIEDRTATSLSVMLDVSEGALSGARDVVIGSTQLINGFAVYDRVDYVKVLPEEALSRVGGAKVPKQFVQFEAVAFHRGPDDAPLTEDDVDLGVVQPEWSLEEYYIRHGDDDVDYVGSIDRNGFFTPAVDGPNFERELNADNMGDVWVVATYQPPMADGSSEALRGRSRLVVTIPIFLYWELFP